MLPASVRHLESYFAGRVDPVDYGAVLRCLDDPSSEIRQVVLVAPDVELPHVAAVMSGLVEDAECQELFGHWFATAKISTLGHGSGPPQFDRDAFPVEERFHCLYVPPQYLIQACS